MGWSNSLSLLRSSATDDHGASTGSSASPSSEISRPGTGSGACTGPDEDAGAPLVEDEDSVEAVVAERLPTPHRRRTRLSEDVIVEGLEDMLVRMAKCCGPVPGDDIIGFVTLGRGVSVHRADCSNIGSVSDRTERLVDVAWADSHSESFFVWIQVEALDRPRLLRDVTASLSDHGANIQASSSVTGRDRIALLRYEIELSDRETLEHVLASLRTIDGVYDAYRLVV